MSLTPWCCWPPAPPVIAPPVTGVFVASALLDMDYPPGASSTFGISQIVGIGLGHVRLTLSTPIALENFNGQATPMDTKAGVTADVNWLDSTHVDVYSYDDAPDPVATIVSVLITYVNSVQTTPLLNPSQILGGNLAVWLQGNLGAGAGPTVTNWVNQVTGNGDAVQGATPGTPVLAAGAFGLNPGVNFVAADASLEIHLTTPFAIGQRPYAMARAKLNALNHNANEDQTLFQAFPDPPVSDSQFEFDAEATGTFDPSDAFWNMNAGGLGTVETFATLSPPPDADSQLLGTHTIQVATEQTAALVVDALSTDAPSAVPAITTAINRVRINASTAALPAGSFGFWNIGVFIMAYNTPSAPQIAALKAWCEAYG